MKEVAAVVFEGGSPRSYVEWLVAEFRKAIVLDSICKLKGVREISRVILLTNHEDLSSEAARLGVEVMFSSGTGPFCFGEALLEVIEACGMESIVYLGGGAGSLLTQEEIRRVAREVATRKACVVANNFFSADIVGFTPASSIALDPLPLHDNELAMALVHEKGLPYVPMEDSVGTAFDVDTPTDVAVLAIHPDAGPHFMRCVQRLKLDLSRVKAVRDAILVPYIEVALLGRISPSCILYLNRNTRARLRVFSEERGMKAFGREARGEVVSFLGYLMEHVGFEGFFAELARVVRVAFVDSRVIFAHFKLRPSREDRFNSDLGNIEEISDPLVRRITEAVLAAPMTSLLGGHSLVSGGIRAIVDAGRRGLMAEASATRF